MKRLLTTLLCCLLFNLSNAQIIAPDTICNGATVGFTSAKPAVTYHWDFSDVNVVQPFAAPTIMATGFNIPAWTCFMKDGANYYCFVTEYTTGLLKRLSFGTNINNPPTLTTFGPFSTAGNTEGIDIVQDEATGLWYGVQVNYSQMVILEFGSALSNTPTVTVTSYPQLLWPHQVTVKRIAGDWHAFVANRNGTLLRFDFGSMLTNPPTITLIPNVGGVANPCNFTLYQQGSNWYMLINSLINGTCSRYNFGTNLLNNAPTGTLLPSPPGLLNLPRGICIHPDCHNNLLAYIINESGNITKLDFSGDITSMPVYTSLGPSGTANLSSAAPCAYDDSFCYLIPNYGTGTVSRLRPISFSTPTVLNYFNPTAPYTYTAPGTYDVTLFYDFGRPSGPSVACKTIVVGNGTVSGAPNICVGATTAYSGSPSGGTWSSSAPGTASVSPSGSVLGVAPGTAIISYVSPAGCTATAVITVSPVPSITGPTSLCVGGTITLTSSVPGTWSSGNPAVAVINATTGVVTGLSAGTVAMTCPAGGVCTATIILTVSPFAPITGPTTICMGSTSSLADAVPGGTWSSANPSVATIDAGGTITPVAAGTSVISYATSPDCVATVTVTVLGAAPVSGTTYMCVGNNTTLSSSVPGGTWSSSNTAIATVGIGSGIVHGESAGTAVISYAFGSCSSQIIVTVNPLPDVITGITSVCPGAAATLSNTVAGGTWTSGNTAVATIDVTTGLFTGIAPGTATITYMLLSGCFITTVVNVYTAASPITGSLSVCQESAGNLYNTAPGGLWTSSDPAIVSVDPGTGIVNGLTIGSATITYTLAGGCYITAVVTVKGPSAPPGVTDIDYCQFSRLASALTATGTALLWYDAASGTPPLTAAPVPGTNVPGITTWYVSQNLNGCESPRIPIHVHIHPMLPINIGGEVQVCQGDTARLFAGAASFPGISYLWQVPPYASILNGTPGDSLIFIKFDTSMHHNYVVLTVNDGYTPCSVFDTVDVRVISQLPQAFFYIKPDVCRGDSVEVALTSHVDGITDYIWNFDGGRVVVANSNHGGPFKVVWDTLGLHIVTVRSITSAVCPPHDAADTFTVHEPDARIAPVTDDICASDSLLLMPLNYADGSSYHWAPEHFFNQNNASSTYGRIEIAGYVTMTVTDPFGCTASSRIFVNPDACCKVFLPNAFTPGAETNNLFRPVTNGNHKIHIFRVENRWGQTVYQSAQEHCGWNGMFNGVPQDADTYFYYFKYDCAGKTIEMKGDVTLIR